MEEVKFLSSLEEIKAFSDPYRLQLLTTYRNFGQPATVKEVADYLKETPAKVHYHVKKLEKAGIIRLVYTQEINGIVAKYYEPTAERFVIRHKEHGKELNKVIQNESQRIVANFYNNSKNLVLEAMLNPNYYQDKERLVEFISLDGFYLTQEEAKEFRDFLKKLNRKPPKSPEEGRIKYHSFTVLVPIREDHND